MVVIAGSSRLKALDARTLRTVEQQTFGFEIDPLAGSELGAYVEHLGRARHQGQIILLRKYLIDGADADFDPYQGSCRSY